MCFREFDDDGLVGVVSCRSSLGVTRPLLCPIAANSVFERVAVVILSSRCGLLLLGAMRETIDSSKFTEQWLSLRWCFGRDSGAHRWIAYQQRRWCQLDTRRPIMWQGRQYQKPRSDSKTTAFLSRRSCQQLVSSSTVRFHVLEVLTGCEQFTNSGRLHPRPHSPILGAHSTG